MSLLLTNATVWVWTDIKRGEGKAIAGSWVAISKQGWIMEIGITNSAPPPFQNFDNVLSIEGQLVLPGLQDAHIHIAAVGESQYFVDLSCCNSIDELRNTLREQLSSRTDLGCIYGVNWDQKKLGRYPSRRDIDDIAPHTPVFLWRACWHIGKVCSSDRLLMTVIYETHDSLYLYRSGEYRFIASDTTNASTI